MDYLTNYLHDYSEIYLPEVEIYLGYELFFYPYSSGDYDHGIEYNEINYSIEFYYYFNGDIATREYIGLIEDLTAFDMSEFFDYVYFEDSSESGGEEIYLNIPSPSIYQGFTNTLNMNVEIEEQLVEFSLWGNNTLIERETIYLNEDINNQGQEFTLYIPVIVDAFQFNEYYIENWSNYYNDNVGLESYDFGYHTGYNQGYSAGEINRPLTTFGSVINVISDNASNLLQTEILPNFTISNIIFIPVIFSLLGIILKFFRR